MHHNLSLITTFAAALGFGLLFGMLALRLRLPALVGYLAAGVLIGPATPGFVADVAPVRPAGRDRRDAADVRRRPAFLDQGPDGGAQDRAARRDPADRRGHRDGRRAWRTGGAGASAPAWCSAWRCRCASTVVLLRALEDRGILDSLNGRIAVGWLVVEDLVTVLVLVLLPALSGSLGGDGGDSDAAAVADAGHHPRPGRRLRRLHADRRPQAVPVAAVARGEDRLARDVHAVRHRRGGRHRLRLVGDFRRVVRARRLLRRHGAARVGAEPPRRRRIAAAARRVLGAVLRLGRHAVRPDGAGAKPAAGAGGGRRHHLRQIAGRVRAGAAAALSAQHGADGVGQPGADRRILVHPGRHGHAAEAAAGRRPEPDPGRRHHFDRGQSAAVQGGRAAAAVDPLEVRAGAADGAGGRSAGRTADDDRPCEAQRAGGAGRVWPRGPAHRAGADQPAACTSSSPSRTGSWSRNCASRACRRWRATPASRRC